MRALRRLAAVLVTALVVPVAAHAAAPRLIMISGLELKRPVVLSDWQQNLQIMIECVNAPVLPAAQIKLRPHYQVGEFWGPVWNYYVDQGNPLSDLKPSQANQFGAFYPAHAGKPAAISITVGGRYVPLRAGPVLLAALKTHGVRTRLQP